MSATIVGLFIAPGKGVPMQSRPSVTAITGLGLEGDWHARPESKRQVLLMDEETLNAFGLPPGRVRENITTRGIALKTLERGTQLRIGEAVLEITLPCTPCEFIDEIRPGLREKMLGQRGMLARVVQGGKITIGDTIEVKP
jgi:MOSC domain-containing protein YiiM